MHDGITISTQVSCEEKCNSEYQILAPRLRLVPGALMNQTQSVLESRELRELVINGKLSSVKNLRIWTEARTTEYG